MEVVKRQNLSEMVAGRIKTMILDNSLKVGDRLPTEQEMAERFGVSRVSVREATKALSFLGIIRSAPRRGLTVGKVDMARVTEYLGFHLALADYPKLQLLQTRLVIELGALPYVMARMADDPELYNRLIGMTRDLAETRDLDARIAGDIAFHRCLLESSGVEPLVVFNDLLQIFFNRFRESLVDAQWEQGIRGHRSIIEALHARNLPEATEALRSHLDYHKARI